MYRPPHEIPLWPTGATIIAFSGKLDTATFIHSSVQAAQRLRNLCKAAKFLAQSLGERAGPSLAQRVTVDPYNRHDGLAA